MESCNLQVASKVIARVSCGTATRHVRRDSNRGPSGWVWHSRNDGTMGCNILQILIVCVPARNLKMHLSASLPADSRLAWTCGSRACSRGKSGRVSTTRLADSKRVEALLQRDRRYTLVHSAYCLASLGSKARGPPRQVADGTCSGDAGCCPTVGCAVVHFLWFTVNHLGNMAHVQESADCIRVGRCRRQ